MFDLLAVLAMFLCSFDFKFDLFSIHSLQIHVEDIYLISSFFLCHELHLASGHPETLYTVAHIYCCGLLLNRLGQIFSPIFILCNHTGDMLKIPVSC